MGQARTIRRVGVILLIGCALSVAFIARSFAADKIERHPAPALQPFGVRQPSLGSNEKAAPPGASLTHQTHSSGQAAGSQPNTNCSPMKIETPRTLPPGIVNRPLSFTLMTTGGFPPVSYALMKGAVLPPGLRLDSTGRLSGTPSAPGRFQFGVMAYDRCPTGVQSEETQFILSIQNAAPATLQSQHETLHRQIPDRQATVFQLVGVNLFFENRGASIVVAQNDALPPLVARVRLKGAGLVRGYWQVDDGPVHPFAQQLRGPVASLPFPETLTLETSEPGRHDITLVVTSADKALPESIASYRILTGRGGRDDRIDRQLMVTVVPRNGPAVETRLVKSYALRPVTSLDIQSLGFRTYVFESDGNIPDLLAAIRKEPDVLLAERNQVFKTFGDPKSGLQQIARIFHFEALHGHARGRGVRVAVIDTGVDSGHRELADRVIANENMVAENPPPPEIHGTAVAGIIGASENGFGMVGVAPEAELLALRACRQVAANNPAGRGDTVAMVRALDMALVKKAKVVNMSFGAAQPDRLMEMLLEKGVAGGVLFVAPVGNERGMKSARFPASSRLVIAVGGRDAKGRPYPDAHAIAFASVSAPAENIFTAIPGGRFNFLTGTSMSSAIVAGLLALAAERKPGIGLDDLPPFESSVCLWLDQLMQLSICQQQEGDAAPLNTTDGE
jgi:hypothetical protein